LAVGCAFGSFSFWTLGRCDSSLFDGMYISRVVCSALAFQPRRSKIFLPISSGLHPYELMFWTCLCVVSKLNMLSLLLMYLVGLEPSFSFMIFFFAGLACESVAPLIYWTFGNYHIALQVSSSISLTKWLWSWPAHNAFMACVMACLSETSGACALRRRNLRKKTSSVSLSYCWHEKKSSPVIRSA
jgi:hypothetical protein